MYQAEGGRGGAKEMSTVTASVCPSIPRSGWGASDGLSRAAGRDVAVEGRGREMHVTRLHQISQAAVATLGLSQNEPLSPGRHRGVRMGEIWEAGHERLQSGLLSLSLITLALYRHPDPDEQCITQKYKGGRGGRKKNTGFTLYISLKYIQSKISYISMIMSCSQTTAPVCKCARFLFRFACECDAGASRRACARASLKAATYLVKE